ncbi:hypothetical protein PPYC1_24625 [Paenibacillus polymyxa]|nr:hypothetical protein PPYC1_24625 [Paenibacillus polymyxa]
MTVDLGLNADGTRNRPRTSITIEEPALMKLSVKCAKLSEAPKKLREYLDDQLADFKREVLRGNYIAPSKMTFKDFYENKWKPKHAVIEYKNGTTLKSHCSKTTITYYRRLDTNYLMRSRQWNWLSYLLIYENQALASTNEEAKTNYRLERFNTLMM